MSAAKPKRGIADYVICGVGALFICTYLSMGFQPVTSSVDNPGPVAQEQKAQQEPQAKQEPQANREPQARQEPAAAPVLSDMRATFIDVGQGDSTLVELPDGKIMLVDAGEASSSQGVLDALEAAEVDEIDYLVATHPHADHIGGMRAVLDAYEVDEVWMPDADDATETYEGFLDAVDAEGCPVQEAVAGEEIVDDDAGYAVDILAPAVGVDSDDLNRHSAIVRVRYGDTSLLVTGDADAAQVAEASPGHVDVLRASHHGSETGTNAEVMSATTPAFVILSYAEGNSYGHPDQSVLDAVAAAGATVYSTAANGDVTCSFDGESVAVETERDGLITAGVSAEERARREAEVQAQAEAEARAQAEAQAQAQSQQQQQTAPQEQTVMIAPTGSKYHRPGCRTLSRSKSLTEMPESQARAQGYEPCKVCKP